MNDWGLNVSKLTNTQDAIRKLYKDGGKENVFFTCKTTKGGRVHLAEGNLGLNQKGVLQVSDYAIIGGNDVCGSVITPTIRLTGKHLITCPYCLEILNGFVVDLDATNKNAEFDLPFIGKDKCDSCGAFKPRIELKFSTGRREWLCEECIERLKATKT